ncbi:hypothetical protein CEXT_102421 [Caerostris extrusa]|uniref:Uncharacterized protein n=1 Tax=Caerostris extrusa TaxID=172846 RepID=A0AAV4N4F5_CAEEX|nr:hypothetical protein CEXT_102421 [Caerostris extrusa]
MPACSTNASSCSTRLVIFSIFSRTHHHMRRERSFSIVLRNLPNVKSVHKQYTLKTKISMNIAWNVIKRMTRHFWFDLLEISPLNKKKKKHYRPHGSSWDFYCRDSSYRMHFRKVAVKTPAHYDFGFTG